MDTRHYNVVITEEARLDMVRIHNYIAYELFSPVAAEKQYRKIAEAAQELEFFPLRCSVVASGPDYPGEIRRRVVGKYSVFYFVQGDLVVVTDVIYGPSNFERRLKTIKERIEQFGSKG